MGTNASKKEHIYLPSLSFLIPIPQKGASALEKQLFPVLRKKMHKLSIKPCSRMEMCFVN